MHYPTVLRRVLGSLLTTQLFFGVSTFAAAQATWQSAAPMPLGVQEIYADVMNEKIYVGGGIPAEQENFSNQFVAYDPQSDEWSTLAPIPAKRHHITISAVGGKIYGFGGFTGVFPDWLIQNTTYIYDDASNTWSDGPDMPVARGEHVALDVDGKIYAIGGRIAGAPGAKSFLEYVDTNSVDVFDTKQQTWSSGTSAPTPRNSQAAAVIDGKIYVVGGRQTQKDLDGKMRIVNVRTLEVYDPKADQWETKAAMPLAQGGLAAAAYDGKLYVFGGEQWFPEKKLFSNAWVYEPEVDRWGPVPDMSMARHGLAAATIGSSIFVFGGANKNGVGAIDNHEVLRIP